MGKKEISDIYDKCFEIIEKEKTGDNNFYKKLEKLKKSFNEYKKTYKLTQEFFSLVHEIRTYDYLKKKGIEIEAGDDNKAGPDFETQIGYIECVSVTKGEGETRTYIDKIMNRDFKLGNTLPVAKSKTILSRITSVIKDKTEKYDSYLKENKIKNFSKPLLIAVNTSFFSEDYCSELDIDTMFKILYCDYKIKKNNDVDLCLNYFANPIYKILSAVILVNNYLGEAITKDTFNIFVNPEANVKMNLEILKKFDFRLYLNR